MQEKMDISIDEQEEDRESGWIARDEDELNFRTRQGLATTCSTRFASFGDSL